MLYPIRLWFVVLLTVILGRPVGAEDKPPAKATDARRPALVRAGYTPVPLTVGPWGNLVPYVEGTVGTEKARFLLDSGCRETVLDLAVAKRLKLKLGQEAELVGLGKRWVGRRVLFPGLTFGPYDFHKDLGMDRRPGDRPEWV